MLTSDHRTQRGSFVDEGGGGPGETRVPGDGGISLQVKMWIWILCVKIFVRINGRCVSTCGCACYKQGLVDPN